MQKEHLVLKSQSAESSQHLHAVMWLIVSGKSQVLHDPYSRGGGNQFKYEVREEGWKSL